MDRFDLEYTILTGGATFSTIIAKDGETSTLLTPHVEVADTVGAGDSFPAPSPVRSCPVPPSRKRIARP